MAGFQIPNRTFVATSNILPATFVTLSGSDQIAQSTTGDIPIGVSQFYQKLFNDANAAESGDACGTYGNGEECWLTYGGSVTAGDRLGPNSLGKAITVALSVSSGAIALESGSTGEQHRVRVQIEDVKLS